MDSSWKAAGRLALDATEVAPHVDRWLNLRACAHEAVERLVAPASLTAPMGFDWAAWQRDVEGCFAVFGAAFFHAMRPHLADAYNGDGVAPPVVEPARPPVAAVAAPQAPPKAPPSEPEAPRAASPSPAAPKNGVLGSGKVAPPAVELARAPAPRPEAAVGPTQGGGSAAPAPLPKAAPLVARASEPPHKAKAAPPPKATPAAPPPKAAPPPEVPARLTTATLKTLQSKMRDGSLGGLNEGPDFSREETLLRRGRALWKAIEAGNAQTIVEELAHGAQLRFLRDISHALGAPVVKVWMELLAAAAQILLEKGGQERKFAQEVIGSINDNRKDLKLSERVHGLSDKQKPNHLDWKRDAQFCLERLDQMLGGAHVEPKRGLDEGTTQRRVTELLGQAEDEAALRSGIQALMQEGWSPNVCVLRLLVPFEEDLKGSNFSKLREQLRKQRAQDEDDEKNDKAEQSLSALPDEWPYWWLTKDRVAVVLGSAGKSHQLKGIKERFRFKDVTHRPGSLMGRKAQGLLGNIRDGDPRIFLVMHRYISHNVSDAIWKHRHTVQVVGVDDGFNASAVQRALEDFGRKLPPPVAPEPAQGAPVVAVERAQRDSTDYLQPTHQPSDEPDPLPPQEPPHEETADLDAPALAAPPDALAAPPEDLPQDLIQASMEHEAPQEDAAHEAPHEDTAAPSETLLEGEAAPDATHEG